MKNQRPIKPKLTFTLSQYQLAHCLEIIQALEPSYYPVSLNQMVKLIVQDYIAKMAIVRNHVPSERTLATINQMLNGNSGRIELSSDNQLLAEIMASKPARATKETADCHKAQTQHVVDMDMEKLEVRYLAAQQELRSKSQKTIVTDFSPPSKEELNND